MKVYKLVYDMICSILYCFVAYHKMHGICFSKCSLDGSGYRRQPSTSPMRHAFFLASFSLLGILPGLKHAVIDASSETELVKW